MDGRIIARTEVGSERLALAPYWLGSIAAGTALGLLLVVSLLLLARRTIGVPLQPLHPLAMLAVAITVTAVAGVTRLAWTAARGRAIVPELALLRLAAPSLVLLILGATLWLPSTDGWSLAAYWGVVGVGEVIWWLPAIADWRRTAVRRHVWAPVVESGSPPIPVAGPDATAAEPASLPGGPLREVAGLSSADQAMEVGEPREDDEPIEDDGPGVDDGPGEDEGDAEPDEEAGWPAGLIQQLTRTRGDDGTELVYGVLRGEFAVGERQQTLHVAFSPPLPSLPRMTAHQVEGPDAQIKVADSQTYGVRLELRLARPSQRPESVLLEMQVACDAASSEPT